MINNVTLKKLGSVVCLGSNGFTVLENNKSYYLNNIILDHKTGQKNVPRALG